MSKPTQDDETSCDAIKLLIWYKKKIKDEKIKHWRNLIHWLIRVGAKTIREEVEP